MPFSPSQFRNPEEATSAMVFDNVAHMGTVLKIRRPKDYVPEPGAELGAPHIPGIISSNVPDSPNKVFIGGLPSYLNDEQVIELLKSFGELKAFNLVKENGDPDKSKVSFSFRPSFGFLASSCSTPRRVAETASLSIGLRFLRVRRPGDHRGCHSRPQQHGARRPLPRRSTRLCRRQPQPRRSPSLRC
jgi:RNA recognition motif-containing protein